MDSPEIESISYPVLDSSIKRNNSPQPHMGLF